MRDIAFTPQILDQGSRGTLPNGEVIRLQNADHHVQEDAHERIVPALLAFFGREVA